MQQNEDFSGLPYDSGIMCFSSLYFVGLWTWLREIRGEMTEITILYFIPTLCSHCKRYSSLLILNE